MRDERAVLLYWQSINGSQIVACKLLNTWRLQLLVVAFVNLNTQISLPFHFIAYFGGHPFCLSCHPTNSVESLNWALPFLLNLCRLTYVHLCMPVLPLVPSDSPTLISSQLRLSAHHLALTASASRPTTASRPSNPLNPSPLAPEIRLC